MPTVTISIANLDQVKANFVGIRDDQLPFATVQALTWTAKDVQRAIQQQTLPAHFVLRAPAWMKANIRIKPATKQELRAAVIDTFRSMMLQEEGGTKIPYGNAIAVPLSGIRPWGSRKLIPPELRPHAIMQQGGFIRDGIMYAVVLKRGRGGSLRAGKLGALGGIQRAASWSRQILPMYALVKKAAIPERYGFAEQARKTVAETFAGNFSKGFRQAVRTAR